jgi:hypothetical protein
MRVLYDELVPVAFHSFWVCRGEWSSDGRGGQDNGLCGAAEPGVLSFTTGLHSGGVPVRLELHAQEPALDPVWEEVVEASFTPGGSEVTLALWDGPTFPLAIEDGDYRVRYCGVGFDNENNGITDPPERYLVQFWPCAPATDRVVRQTSETAAYWHRVARNTPPPPTVEARAEAERHKREASRRRYEQLRREEEARHWGGRPPSSDRLRQIAPWAYTLAQLDRDLLDEIAEAEPQVQRAMSRWAARHICKRVGLAELDWVAAALDALDRSDELPPSFTDLTTALARLYGHPRESVTNRVELTVTVAAEPEPVDIEPENWALQAVLGARRDDPLLAAVCAVTSAAEAIPDERAAVIVTFRDAFGLPPR